MLYGRKDDLAWLDACWNDGVRVASIVAFGGVGKSALVNAWLAEMDAAGWRGAHRIYAWSFYSQGTDRLSSSDEFIAHALKDFGDPDPLQGSAWDKGERLARLVRRERTILVLDGVEPLQWGPGVQEGKLKDNALEALLKGLAAQDGGLCLVTTRIGLTDMGATGGDKVQVKDLRRLSPEAGAELLRARGIEGTDDELRKAAEEYKGHSLALMLLASYLEDVAEKDIQRRYEIGPLMVDERQGGHAKRVMTAYEPWLGKAELAILHMIGLFDRPADDGEIGALRADPMIPGLTDPVAGVGSRDWNKAVAKLRRSGLLLTEQDKRLDAHLLVHEYFGEQLRKGQPEAWREGHRRLYEYLKKKAKPLPDTIEEMALLYAAVVHGCLAGKVGEAHGLYRQRVQRGKMAYARKNLGDFGGQLATLASFFDPPWEHVLPDLDATSRSILFNSVGIALRGMGRLEEAARAYERAVDSWISCWNLEKAAVSATNLSGVTRDHGNLKLAIQRGHQAVDLADRAKCRPWQAGARRTLANAQHQVGALATAQELFEDAERILPGLQDDSFDSASISAYNSLLLDINCPDLAEQRARAAQVKAEQEGWRGDVGLCLYTISCCHLKRGNISAAGSTINMAVDIVRAAGRQRHVTMCLLTRGLVHLAHSNITQCRADLTEALSLATRCEFRLHAADAHLAHTRLALAEHDPAAARHHLTQAKAIIDDTGYHRRDPELTELQTMLPP